VPSMPEQSRAGRRDRVSPWVAVWVGLLVAVLAGVALVLATGPDSPGEAAPATPTAPADQVATSAPEPPPATATAIPEEVAATTTPGALAPPVATTAGPPPEPSAEADAPVSVRITSAGVAGPLAAQGLAPDGTINPGRGEIIWFTGNDRVVPGRVGTAVVAAHVSWGGQPDAFAGLPAVRTGDMVEVGYADGSTTAFTVTTTAAVDKDALARSLTVWGDHPDVPRLAIITCDEAADLQEDGHLAGNVVVIAEAR
jgi:hypothetical protein